MQWSDQQRAIFEAVEQSSRNLIVRARAGSGKTTTALASLEGAKERGKLMTAFNRAIARELQARAPDGVDVQTLHSLGLKTLRQQYGRVEVDPDKGLRIARAVTDDVATPHQADFPRSINVRAARRDLPWMVKQAAALLKQTQPATVDEAVDQVDEAGNIDTRVFSADRITYWAQECMRRAAEAPTVVDFDDMVYLPRKFELQPPMYSLVVVDETQDMNRGQLWLVLMAGARVVAIGDERQAIYRWRGADAEAINTVSKALDAEELPLSTTFRCAPAIVDYVRGTLTDLDDFESGRTDIKGKVEYVSEAAPDAGDFVLSRYNAPLVSSALATARTGARVAVLGRELVKPLTDMIYQSNARTCRDLHSWARAARREEVDALLQDDRRDLIPAARDRYDVLAALASECNEISNVRDALRRLFADRPEQRAVTFSTIHKSKGHERDRVWLMQETLAPPGADIEGDNLRYVGATRAADELYIVDRRDSERTITEDDLADW